MKAGKHTAEAPTRPSARGARSATLLLLVSMLSAFPRAAAAQRAADLSPPRRSASPDGVDASSAPLPPPRSSFDAMEEEAAASAGRGRRHRLSPGEEARLRVLLNDLRLLSLQSGHTTVDGIVSMASGALFLGIGLAVSDLQDVEYLYLWGGGMMALGLAELLLAPDPEEAAVALDHMPAASEEQARARLHFAEARFEEVADRSRWMRITNSLVTLGLSVAVVPMVLAPRDYESSASFPYLFVIGSALGFVQALVTLLTPSQAEKRWNAYLDLRRRLTERVR